MRGLLVAAVVLSLFAAGCLRGTEDVEPGLRTELTEPTQRLHHSVLSHREEVRGQLPSGGPWVYPAEGRVTDEWTFNVTPASSELAIALSWSTPGNDFTLVVSHPDGEDRFTTGEPPLVGEVRWINASYPEPAAGEWTVYATVTGLLRGNDLLVFDAQWQYLEDPALPLIPVIEDGDGWFALYGIQERHVFDEGTIELAVATTNGHVVVTPHDGPEAVVEVRPWARAASEERARDLAAGITTDRVATGSKLELTIAGAAAAADGEAVGAHLVLKVPAAVAGRIATTDGNVKLENVTVDALRLEATEGGIDAVVRSAGELQAATTNGPIHLELEPVAATVLTLRADGGAVRLRLAESEAIGYHLEASTDGGVSATLEEATLSGDGGQQVLETADLEGRAILVRGSVTATGGDIEFTRR